MNKTIFDYFPTDATCKNCKHKNKCDFYRKDREDWFCMNWVKDLKEKKNEI